MAICRLYSVVEGVWHFEAVGCVFLMSDKQSGAPLLSLVDLKTDKPVLIDFHTVWCASCRKMAPIIDEIAEEYKNKAIVMRIDVDKSKDVGNAYNIKAKLKRNQLTKRVH